MSTRPSEMLGDKSLQLKTADMSGYVTAALVIDKEISLDSEKLISEAMNLLDQVKEEEIFRDIQQREIFLRSFKLIIMNDLWNIFSKISEIHRYAATLVKNTVRGLDIPLTSREQISTLRQTLDILAKPNIDHEDIKYLKHLLWDHGFEPVFRIEDRIVEMKTIYSEKDDPNLDS